MAGRMKRPRSRSVQDPAPQHPRPAAPGGTTDAAALAGPAAEGPGLLSTNAASPQGRRMLCFTLNGTAGFSHIATAYRERIDALPNPPATVGVAVDQLPRYVPPAPAR